MGTPYLSEIRIFSFGFAPRNWAMCNGQFLPIAQNQALFSLMGTTYGGNGQTTFALPNLQGRVPVHAGSGFNQGQAAGEAAHTLSIAEMPSHTHMAQASTQPGNQVTAANNVLASPANLSYAPFGSSPTSLVPSTITNMGGSQAHNNMQPYLALNFCIALQGIFPSRN